MSCVLCLVFVMLSDVWLLKCWSLLCSYVIVLFWLLNVVVVCVMMCVRWIVLLDFFGDRCLCVWWWWFSVWCGMMNVSLFDFSLCLDSWLIIDMLMCVFVSLVRLVFEWMWIVSSCLRIVNLVCCGWVMFEGWKVMVFMSFFW